MNKILFQAGTVQVRIRRDANESHVLDRVMAGLSRIVTTLTVQEFRETQRYNYEYEHCTEYYINELLPNTGDNKAPRMPRSGIDDPETVSIDDILGVEKEPVGTFLNSSGVKTSGDKKNITEKHKINNIYDNKNLEVKNYLFNPKKALKENALLIGSNVDEDRFNNCSIQINSIGGIQG